MSDKKYLYGLDISLKNTGLVIYDLEKKEFVFIGSFSTENVKATKEYKGLHLNAIKLHKIKEWLTPIIENFPPYVISIERMFSRFPLETQAIAKATGLIQSLLWDIPQFLYPPKQIKATIVHGNATKEDVANAIKLTYNYIFTNEDESDAFATVLMLLIEHELIEWEKPDFALIVAMRVPKEKKAKKAAKKPAVRKPRKKKAADE